MRPLCFRVVVYGAIAGGDAQLGVVDVQTVGADQACFERVDEGFEEWKAGAYQGEEEHGLSEENGDPEVVE